MVPPVKPEAETQNVHAYACVEHMLPTNLSIDAALWLEDQRGGGWVSGWFCLMAFLKTVDIEVHIVYISHIIIAYTLESLSSLT